MVSQRLQVTMPLVWMVSGTLLGPMPRVLLWTSSTTSPRRPKSPDALIDIMHSSKSVLIPKAELATGSERPRPCCRL